ncbi:MAG: RagB/SusD family nutrient uptake outer membrane protein [Bacteroidota bacterium]
MKNISSIACLFFLCLSSCSEDFLERQPLGVVGERQLETEDGAYALLMGAYSLLDGIGTDNNGYWQAAGSNFIYGSIASDDAYKGASAPEQSPISQIERYETTAQNGFLDNKWRTLYDGISRCNDAIRVSQNVTDLSEETRNVFLAEARFLRAHYHFDAVQLWGYIPYVDETVLDLSELENTIIPWEQIEADLSFAVTHLPAVQIQAGRATSWAAKAYQAKVHLFQEEYSQAKGLLDDILDNGPFELMDCYHDNFRIAGNNNAESIFEIQHSVNDGTNGENGNFGEVLNYPYAAGPAGCCGLHQPSQNLVNAHQTTDQGLPLIDQFNDLDVKHDEGIPSENAFSEHSGNLDPRLDWSVGRRGIPFLDWGDHPGKNWIRDQAYGGPYSPKKNAFYASEKGTGSTASGWAKGANANNLRLIRLAHIILWRAEVAVHEGELELARKLTNRLRNRAANGCWVLEGGVADNGSHSGPNGEEPAANYVIASYPVGHPVFLNQADALKAIHMESRLEFAMEGNRFFDLVRWKIAHQTLNDYLNAEHQLRSYLDGSFFLEGQHELFPIPSSQLRSIQKLKQNTGY